MISSGPLWRGESTFCRWSCVRFAGLVHWSILHMSLQSAHEVREAIDMAHDPRPLRLAEAAVRVYRYMPAGRIHEAENIQALLPQLGAAQMTVTWVSSASTGRAWRR